MRLVGFAWMLAAVVAGLIAALLLGIGERPSERVLGFALALGAAAAWAMASLAQRQPSGRVAWWSVALATVWVVSATLYAPPDLHPADRDTTLLLPAVSPIVAGLASLYTIAARRRRT